MAKEVKLAEVEAVKPVESKLKEGVELEVLDPSFAFVSNGCIFGVNDKFTAGKDVPLATCEIYLEKGVVAWVSRN